MSVQPLRGELLAAAKEAEAAKDFDRAARLYREYLTRRPEDDEVRALFARVLSWQGRHEEAVTLYQDILSRHPVDIDVRVALARVRSWQQRLEEAIGLYTGVLNEDPTNVEAKQGLADTLYWSKRHQEALRLYQDVYENQGSGDRSTDSGCDPRNHPAGPRARAGTTDGACHSFSRLCEARIQPLHLYQPIPRRA